MSLLLSSIHSERRIPLLMGDPYPPGGESGLPIACGLPASVDNAIYWQNCVVLQVVNNLLFVQ